MTNRLVYVDAAPFIYFIEGNLSYEQSLDPFFSMLARENFRAITSTVTLAEILVKPYRGKQWSLAEKYESILKERPN